MAKGLVEDRRVPAHQGDQTAGGQCRSGASQHDPVGTDEVELLRQIAAQHAERHLGFGIDLLQGHEPQLLRRHELPESRRGRDAQPAIGVIQERPRAIHATRIRSLRRSASDNLAT